MPIPASFAVPSLSLDGFPNKNPPRPIADMANAGATSGFVTPAEPHYMGQSNDGLGQRQLPYYFHQQDLQPFNKKRRFLGEPDMRTDNQSDCRLLSDFLVAAPDMSFDFVL